MLSSTNKSNHYQGISDNIDHRTNGYKARKGSMLSKPEAAVKLIKEALDTGITADYVLMDTYGLQQNQWFVLFLSLVWM